MLKTTPLKQFTMEATEQPSEIMKIDMFKIQKNESAKYVYPGQLHHKYWPLDPFLHKTF